MQALDRDATAQQLPRRPGDIDLVGGDVLVRAAIADARQMHVAVQRAAHARHADRAAAGSGDFLNQILQRRLASTDPDQCA